MNRTSGPNGPLAPKPPSGGFWAFWASVSELVSVTHRTIALKDVSTAVRARARGSFRHSTRGRARARRPNRLANQF